MKQYWVVIGGYYRKETNNTEFEQCIAVCENYKEAYGEALLYLNDFIEDEDKKDKCTITPIYNLEAMGAYGMNIIDDESLTVEYAHIYYYERKEEKGATEE